MALETSMHRSQLPRSGMALGGIGTGSFEIRQDGGFTNWSILNNWPVFPGPRLPHNPKQNLFFMLWVREPDSDPRLILLQIEDSHQSAAIEGQEFQYMFPWISGVDTIRSSMSFPFADLNFEQDGLPLKVSMRAWSPFIPGNTKDSALPLAYFDFDITSTSDQPIDLQVLAVVRNVVAYDQPDRIYENQRVQENEFSAMILGAGQTNPTTGSTGALCLSSHSKKSTAYMGWEHHHPYYERLLREFPMPEVDDTDGRNCTDPSTGQRKADPRCYATIGRAETLTTCGDSLQHSFSLTWHFPNLHARVPGDMDACGRQPHPAGLGPFEGHFYSNYFNSVKEVARYAFDQRERLLLETRNFHDCFFDSGLPSYALDQINSQLNTFHTSTWLTKSRMFGVLEGLAPDQPWAGIGTIDVAMYGQIATSLLFPDLDRMTIELWQHFQQANGIVPHTVPCNSSQVPHHVLTGNRLDLPEQFVFQALRAALWNHDDVWLASVWESAKKSLAYVLRERDANGDHLPDMEGVMCSYDNFPMFGVAPFVASQWLAAVALALKVATKLGDTDFIRKYSDKFTAGCATLKESTWNGSYFKIYSDHQPSDPTGENGCMVDQLIGDGIARQLDLPAIADSATVTTTLRTIMQMNYKSNQGLRNCQWPEDDFLHPVHPDIWVDQANTSWSGVELNFSAQLLYAGLNEEAFEVIHNVDTRHRQWGLYWDHQEYGGHYYRPMAALAIPNAFLGLSYDGQCLKMAPARTLPNGRWCVLLPGCYGTFYKTDNGGRLEIKSGTLHADQIELPVAGEVTLEGIDGIWEVSHATPQSTNFTRQSNASTTA